MDETLRRVFAGQERVSFARYMDYALYHPEVGFYATEGVAGRRGDFLTSPEVGPLFGALIARQLDDYWRALGEPEHFCVVELGAGPGTLARTIAFASPQCLPRLRYVMVEISAAQRKRHGDFLDQWHGDHSVQIAQEFCAGQKFSAGFISCAQQPMINEGVVLANELFDNIPCDIVRHDGRGKFEQLMVVIDESLSTAVESVDIPGPEAEVLNTAKENCWVPRQCNARELVDSTLRSLRNGFMLAFDYGATTFELSQRDELGWLRTYAQHQKSNEVFAAPGSVDITADIAIDQLTLTHSAHCLKQADWLRQRGIDQLVAEGREFWRANAHAPTTEALVARSRIGEAEALCDASGLGGFVVLEWNAQNRDSR